MGHDDPVDTLAATRHGVVSRSQLFEHGLSRRAIDLRTATGRLIVVHTGVYRVSSHPPSWRNRVVAAWLAGGPGCVVSHRAAGYLHGLAGVEPAVEISVDRARTPRLDGVLVHRSGALPLADVESCGPVTRTRVARTLIDLASVLPASGLERALDDALSRQLVTCRYVERRLAELGRAGRKGAGVLARLLAGRTSGRPRTQSEFERRLLALLRRAGLPAPQTQFAVALPDGRTAYLDFAYPRQMLAIEADSYRHHSSKLDWARDHRRNAALIALGWRVLPATWADLTVDSTQFLSLLDRGLRILLPPA